MKGKPSGCDADNTYYCNDKAGPNDTYTTNGVKGTGKSNTWSIFHELGHMMGLKERYYPIYTFDWFQNKTIRTGTEPYPGYKGTMMGSYDGVVTDKTIEDLIYLLNDFINQAKVNGCHIESDVKAINNQEK